MSTGETADKEKEIVKDTKTGKKRKVNSRTPTPVSASVSASDLSVAVTATTTAPSPVTTSTVNADSKKSTVVGDSGADKVKKVKYLIYIIRQYIVVEKNMLLF